MRISASIVTPVWERSGRVRRRLATLGLAVLACGAIVGAGAGPALAEEGRLDMDAACKRQYNEDYSAQVVHERTWLPPAFRWQCVSGDHREPIDLTQACRAEFGDPRAVALIRDPEDPYSWSCVYDYRP